MKFLAIKPIYLLIIAMLMSLTINKVSNFPNLYHISLSPFNVFFVIFFVYCIFYLLLKQNIIINSSSKFIFVLSICFFLWMCLSYIINKEYVYLINFVKIFLFYLLLILYLKFINATIWEYAIFIAGMFSIIYALGNFLDIIPIYKPSSISVMKDADFPVNVSYTGIYVSHGQYGITCITTLTIICLWLKNYYKKYFALLIMPLIIWACLITLSRSTWLAFFLFFSVLFYLQFFIYITKKMKLYLIFTSITILLFLILYVVSTETNIITYCINYIYSMRVESISYRFEQYKFVLENFMDSYMFGAGYEYVANNNFVHNYFLAILYERGIISFMLFIMLNIFILFKFIYYLINFQTRVLCFRMSVLFSGYIAILTESMFFHDYTFLVYWVFIAIVITEFENNESYKLFKKTL